MKVIKPGVKPEDKIYRCDCSRCHCVFEFARSEASPARGHQLDDPALIVKCPTCGTGNYVKQ